MKTHPEDRTKRPGPSRGAIWDGWADTQLVPEKNKFSYHDPSDPCLGLQRAQKAGRIQCCAQARRPPQVAAGGGEGGGSPPVQVLVSASAKR
jgi:hypothetical protein